MALVRGCFASMRSGAGSDRDWVEPGFAVGGQVAIPHDEATADAADAESAVFRHFGLYSQVQEREGMGSFAEETRAALTRF